MLFMCTLTVCIAAKAVVVERVGSEELKEEIVEEVESAETAGKSEALFSKKEGKTLGRREYIKGRCLDGRKMMVVETSGGWVSELPIEGVKDGTRSPLDVAAMACGEEVAKGRPSEVKAFARVAPSEPVRKMDADVDTPRTEEVSNNRGAPKKMPLTCETFLTTPLACAEKMWSITKSTPSN